MPPIRTKPAHDALKLLVDQLEKARAQLTGMEPRLREVEKMPTSTTVDAWVETLRRATRDIEAWCPDPDGPDQFTIDVPPRR